MIVILIDVVGPAGHVAEIISEMIPSMENCMLQLFYFGNVSFTQGVKVTVSHPH